MRDVVGGILYVLSGQSPSWEAKAEALWNRVKQIESWFPAGLPAQENSQAVPTRRPVFLYSLLAALFAITVLYQVRYLPDVVRSQRIDSPFFFVDAGSNRIVLTTSESVSYGIHTGDRLLAVDGVSFTGSGVLGHARAMRRPGVPMVVTIAPKNGNDSDQRTIALPVTAESRNSWDALSAFVVQILLPAVSLLLGFWVVYRRPRDPMAWLLLGLMMSFPHILRVSWRRVGRRGGGKPGSFMTLCSMPCFLS